MNKYQKALNELKNSDIRLLVFKNVSEEEQPTIFDLFHSEIFALQELIDKATPMKVIKIGSDYSSCPKCGQFVNCVENFCHCCGQQLDWRKL